MPDKFLGSSLPETAIAVKEGLAVQGTKITTTFPAGSQGNDRPIPADYQIQVEHE